MSRHTPVADLFLTLVSILMLSLIGGSVFYFVYLAVEFAMWAFSTKG